MRPVPEEAVRWARRARWLRWLDATVAWVGLTVLGALLLPEVDPSAPALLAALVVGAAALAPLRGAWRPVSGVVGLVVSRSVRPGDRVWYVRPGAVETVVVTARRGLRVVIAAAGPAESVTVRRTRVLLVPAEPGVRAAR